MVPPSGRRLPCFYALQVEGFGSIGCDLDGSNGQWFESPVDQPGFEGQTFGMVTLGLVICLGW